MTPEDAEKLINATVAQLSEHFEAVQILVSFPWKNGTQPMFRGRGNWFARQGMCRDFLNNDQAETNARAIAMEMDTGT